MVSQVNKSDVAFYKHLRQSRIFVSVIMRLVHLTHHSGSSPFGTAAW